MEGERFDFISSLPIEVLLQILSFLPVKDAAGTRVLSTFWRSVWKPDGETLEVNSNGEVVRKINTFVKSHKDPQQRKFHFKIPKKKGLKTKDDLILTAATSGKEDLYLDFNGGGNHPYPRFSWSLQLNHLSFAKYSLKTLHLRSVNSFSVALVSNLLSNSQSLKSLSLENCRGLEAVVIRTRGRLAEFAMVDCPEIVCVTLSAQNLQSFRYRGALCHIRVVPDETWILDDVVLDMREGPGEIESDRSALLLSIFQSLKRIKTLAICSWLVERLCTLPKIALGLTQLDGLKELCWVSPRLDPQNMNSLACFLNILPFLERLLVTTRIDQGRCQIPRPFFPGYSDEPQPSMDNASKLNHLEVQLVGFTGTKDKLWLKDLLRKMAENRPWRVVKIPLPSDETNIEA